MKDIKKCMNTPLDHTWEPTNTQKAENHYRDLQIRFQNYTRIRRKHYFTCNGPFLEVEFIKRLQSKPLSYFSPFIPLFIPWFSIYKTVEATLYASIVDNILKLLKPEFLYLILSESDFGFISRFAFLSKLPPNIFILSSSGMGHVAIPWIQCSHKPIVQNGYDHFVSFVGNPRSIRERVEILETARALFGKNLYEARTSDWERIISRSKFSLSPRGLAVATFRTFELLRMAVVPIIITDFIHWLPYYPKLNWSAFSILTNHVEFPRAAIKVLSMKDDEYNKMKTELHRVNKQFFQWDGFFQQLDNFFSGKEHYLSCSFAALTTC